MFTSYVFVLTVSNDDLTLKWIVLLVYLVLAG